VRGGEAPNIGSPWFPSNIDATYLTALSDHTIEAAEHEREKLQILAVGDVVIQV
jgi:hypothetical protein